jgi:hypothetical protein
MDRVIRVEAIDKFDPAGGLLPEAEFKFYMNGKYLGGAAGGKGFATFQLSSTTTARIEVEAIFRGQQEKVAVALNADVIRIPFDPAPKPPRAPRHKKDQRDPQKGIWGGKAEDNGRRLSATHVRSLKRAFEVDLEVESTDGTPLMPPVRFHLHPTFAKTIQDITRLENQGTLAVWEGVQANGTFVVGAQVRDRAGKWLGLEYELNSVKGLPQRFKDRKRVQTNGKTESKPGAGAQRSDGEARPPAAPMPPGSTVDHGGERRRAWFEDMPLDFTRDEPREAEQLLAAAFTTHAELLKLAKYVGLNPANLKTNDTSEVLIDDMLEKARRSDRLVQLIGEVLTDPGREAVHPGFKALMKGHEAALAAGMLRRKPSLATLAALPPSVEIWRDVDTAPLAPAAAGFERIVNAAAGFFEPAVFRRCLAEAEVRTARIEIGGHPRGTGFLVADSLLLTNWHVVQGGVDGAVAIFDNQISAFGSQTPGRAVEFAKDWLAAHSEHAPVAEEIRPTGPPAGTWDFALVRLAEPVGAQGIGPDPQAKGADRRGRYQLDGHAYDFDVAEPILILGHPAGRPVQLSFASPSSAKLTTSANRVRYATNTEGGSSGSPVFNRDWRVVALHHAAGPTSAPGDFNLSTKGTNQGIPIQGIVEELKKQLAGRAELSALGLALP